MVLLVLLHLAVMLFYAWVLLHVSGGYECVNQGCGGECTLLSCCSVHGNS